MDRIPTALDFFITELAALDAKTDQRFQVLEATVSEMNQRFQILEATVSEMKQDIAKILSLLQALND